jgi:RNA polymerase sigma factor (sigma-70 family)
VNQPLDGTQDLLRRLHGGDRRALEELLVRHLDWVRAQVRRRLGAVVRREGETEDFVQAAVVDALDRGPRFVVDSPERFRALLLRMVENNVRDRVRYMHRQQRDCRRQLCRASDSVLVLDAPFRTVTDPGEAAARGERIATLQLALELLEPEDREAIRLREWDGLSFGDVGARLGVGEEAARKRYARALPRLVQKVDALRRAAWGEITGPAGP